MKALLLIDITVWSKWQRVGIVFILSVIFMAAWYFLDLMLLQKKAVKIQKEIYGLQNSISKKVYLLKQEKILQKKFSLMKTKNAKPQFNFNYHGVFSKIENLCHESQVELVEFKPQNFYNKNKLIVCPLTIKFNGRYKNLSLFISKVLELDFWVGLKTVVIKGLDDADDILEMQIKLVVYKKNKDSQKILANNKNVIQSPILYHPNRDIFRRINKGDGIYLWPAKELFFLGLIEQDNIRFGVVKDPVGNIHKLTVGDKVGPNQSKIMAINKAGIITSAKRDNVYRKGENGV